MKLVGSDGRPMKYKVAIVEPIAIMLYPERDAVAREVIRHMADILDAQDEQDQSGQQLRGLMDEIEKNGDDNWKVVVREKHGETGCLGLLQEKNKSVTIPGGQPSIRPVLQCDVCMTRSVWMG